MKKYLIAGSCLFAAATVQAQKTPVKTSPSKTTPAKTTTQVKPLKNAVDSVSYAIGFMVANFYKQQGIQKLNTAAITKAINDIYNNQKTLLNEQEANLALMRYMNPELGKNIDEGEKFLADTKKKPGVKSTASGILYEVLNQGTGPKPAATDSVTVNYKGSFINGNIFDQNNGITFRLDQVIPGWTEAVQLMPVGSKYKIYIPYQLAYGLNGQGPIPGGSVLVFEVELLGIKGK